LQAMEGGRVVLAQQRDGQDFGQGEEFEVHGGFGLGLKHRVHGGRGLARRQALEIGSSCRNEQRMEAASQVEMRVGQQLAVAHSQEQRAAGFSGKLPEPVERDEGRLGGRV